jgi:hypothetical protein
MGDHGVVPPGAMTEYLDGLLHPPTPGPAPVQDISSILLDPAQHFQLDIDQAPKAIAAFRQAAEGLRDLMVDAMRLANVRAPGLDAVSINAAREIGQWAAKADAGSLRSTLESGAIQLEKAADALEQSLATYRNAEEANVAYLNQSEL